MQPLLEPSLQESLRRSLVPSSVQELGRRGYREVKVLPREAVNQLVADAAAKLLGERLERAIAAERARVEPEHEAARAEVLFLMEELERARIDRAAAERRAEAARLEREAALEEAPSARRARTDALRQVEEAEEAFQGARRAAAAAEAALAEARQGFETQLRAVIADPLSFGARLPERKGHRLARRRVADTVRRMSAELRRLRVRAAAASAALDAPPTPRAAIVDVPRGTLPDPVAPKANVSRGTLSDGPARPDALELVWRRSVGFGLARATEPQDRARPPVEPRPPITQALAPTAVDLSPLEARLAAIESKLDRALERRGPVGRASTSAPAADVDADADADEPGIPSRFGPGSRGGLRKVDPRFQEKNAILRTLLNDNVKLRKAIGGIGGTHHGTP